MAASRARRLGGLGLLAAVYILAGKLGLALALVNPSATAVWPPTGISLAAVLVFGPSVWPAILVGAFVTNVLTAGTVITSLLIAAGNTLEAVIGAALIQRFARGRATFETAESTFGFVLFGGFIATAVSATIGVTTLWMFGLATGSAFEVTWLTWWLGDAAGALVVTPALVLWHEDHRIRWRAAQWLELTAVALTAVTVAWFVFGASRYPLTFLCIPVIVWAASRYGHREASVITCLISAIAIWETVHGRGTFGGHSVNERLLLLQLFMAVTSIAGIAIGASARGRAGAEEQLMLANDELEARVRARASELAAANERLLATESRLNEAQTLAHVGSWQWTVADDTEWWSEELYRIFGVDPASFSPSYRAFKAMLPEEERSTVDARVQRAFTDHLPFEFEHRIVRPDGTVRVLYSRGRVHLDGTGRVVTMSGASQDITERKADEEIVRRSERRLQTIIDAEPACVTLVSGDGILLDINPAGVEMLGAGSLDEVKGRRLSDLIHYDDVDRVVEMHRNVCAGKAHRGEFRIRTLDGTERWVDSHLVPFDGHAGADAQRTVLGVTSDVTERKRLEEQLRQSQKLEAIGLLAGGIAHDFNNLLTAIGGYTDLVLDTFEQGDLRRDDLQEVAKAAQRATALTRHLLAVSRRQVLQPTVLNVNGMVTDIQKLLHRTIPESIDIQLDLAAELEMVRADRGQLEQVMLNLAINAADAMPEGGRLRLATETVVVDEELARRRRPMTPGRYVRMTVSDTGIGMGPDTLAHIFEPFFTTKQRGKGTGLGLATVYGIVKQSNGFIWVESAEARGTTFEIYLPAVHEAATPTVEVPESPRLTGGSQAVLLVEDDGAVRRFARHVLASNGYTVLAARDGDEALTIARRYEGRIDLLVADVVMPGLSGRDLAVRLAAERPGVRVLYTSGYAEQMISRAGVQHGIALLPKPFLPTDLLQKVGETLAT
jgi:PAS domain S-box-containing protein